VVAFSSGLRDKGEEPREGHWGGRWRDRALLFVPDPVTFGTRVLLSLVMSVRGELGDGDAV